MSVVPIDAGDGQAHVKYDRLVAAAKLVPSAVTIVVHPCDESSLRGVCEAAAAGIIKPILVGPAGKIKAVAAQFKFDISRFEIVDAEHSEAAAAKAVQLIHEAKGELLMKGSLHTDELMRSVTAKSTGLRTDRRISHVFAIDVPGYAQTLFITDAAINIFPDLDCKRDIVQNAVDLYAGIGLGVPRVAILSAVETVTSKIPSTCLRGQNHQTPSLQVRAVGCRERLPSVALRRHHRTGRGRKGGVQVAFNPPSLIR